MKYSIDKKEKYAVFQLAEEKPQFTIAPELKSELVYFANEGVRNLVDLSNVQYVTLFRVECHTHCQPALKEVGTFMI
ncbi:MAG: hypothetical protein R2795_05000 [Saprospiraceae bacterium]